MDKIFNQNERIIIRDLNIKDVDALYRIFTTPDFEYHSTLNSLESAQEFCERAISRRSLKNKGVRASFRMAITNTDNDFIGYVGAGAVDPHSNVAEFGYELGVFIDPAYQRQNYAFESLNLLIKQCFDNYGISRFYATVHPDNVASEKLIEKLGMIYQKELEHDLAELLFEGPRKLYALSL